MLNNKRQFHKGIRNILKRGQVFVIFVDRPHVLLIYRFVETYTELFKLKLVLET